MELPEGEEPPAVSRAASVVLRYYAHYAKGFLPRAGGVAEQPAFLLECLEVCRDTVARWERERHEERMAGDGPKGRGPRILGRLSEEDARRPDWRRRLRK